MGKSSVKLKELWRVEEKNIFHMMSSQSMTAQVSDTPRLQRRMEFRHWDGSFPHLRIDLLDIKRRHLTLLLKRFEDL